MRLHEHLITKLFNMVLSLLLLCPLNPASATDDGFSKRRGLLGGEEPAASLVLRGQW